MGPDWIAEDRAALATSRLLDAAGAVFAEHGVQATTMAKVAAAAGCSRATLYNHFADRRALELAFVHREALRISAEATEALSGLADPEQRATTAFEFILDRVRSDPSLLAWFSASDVGVATAISSDSEVLGAMASAFAGRLAKELPEADAVRRGRWLVRMIVSLLAMPESDSMEERRVIADFVVPALLAAPPIPTGVAD